MKIIKKILAAVVVAVTVASMGATASAATKVSGSLYAPIPTAKEVVSKVIDGQKYTLNVNAFEMEGPLSTAKVQGYLGDDLYITVTQNGTGKIMNKGCFDLVYRNSDNTICPNLETYKHGSRWWFKPATYTVLVWCQQGKNSLNKKAGRPAKVQVAKFTFSVYERGFK